MFTKIYSSARSDLSLVGLDCRQVACFTTRKKCHSCKLFRPDSRCTLAKFKLGRLSRQVCIVAQQFVQQTSLENRVSPVRRSATTLTDQRVGNRPVCPTNTFLCIQRCVCVLSFACLAKYGCTLSQQSATYREGREAARQSSDQQRSRETHPLPVRATVLRRVLRAQQRKWFS